MTRTLKLATKIPIISGSAATAVGVLEEWPMHCWQVVPNLVQPLLTVVFAEHQHDLVSRGSTLPFCDLVDDEVCCHCY